MNRIKMVVAVTIAAVVSGCVTAPEQRGGAFRMMSYNIRHGWGMDGRTDVSRAGEVLARESPRFVGVQEVDQCTQRVKGTNTCEVLARLTGMHATFAKAIDHAGGEYGNAVLSRETPRSVRRIPLPGKEPRVLLLCEFDDCWFGTTHLDVADERSRLGSIEIIRKTVAACGEKPVFLTGDWNSHPDSSVLAGLKEFLTIISDEGQATFHGGAPTGFESQNRNRCIDYVATDTAHSGAFRVLDRRVIPDRVTSDHAPILVDLGR